MKETTIGRQNTKKILDFGRGCPLSVLKKVYKGLATIQFRDWYSHGEDCWALSLDVIENGECVYNDVRYLD